MAKPNAWAVVEKAFDEAVAAAEKARVQALVAHDASRIYLEAVSAAAEAFKLAYATAGSPLVEKPAARKRAKVSPH